MYRNFFKRVIDLIVSTIGLMLISPVFVSVTIILFFLNRKQPFFLQQRPGLGEKLFFVIKFKTMLDKYDTNGVLLPDNQRITKFGNFLRNSSIDELPQLINVFLGDMSLIGPRPLLVRYLNLYSAEQRRRHLVRPGITGLAQVNGRNKLSWSQKFEYDIYYVNNLSIKLDFIILLKTIKKVIGGDGVNQSSSRPMNPFTGGN